MNPNIDFLGICQLLKALQTVGFSENEIKKIARRIAVELGANFTLDRKSTRLNSSHRT